MTNSFSHTLITTFCDQCVPSIHVAFDEVYYLERACMTQLMAMGAAGREAIKVSFFVLHTFSWKRFILCEGDAVESAGSHK